MFRNAAPGSRWVTNLDDDAVERMTEAVSGIHCRFSVDRRSDAFYDRENDTLTVLGRPLLRRDRFSLLGDHNVANALAATLAVMIADPAHTSERELAMLSEGLASFSALEHRIETVGEFDGVTVDQRLEVDERRIDARRAAGHDAADRAAPRRQAQRGAVHRPSRGAEAHRSRGHRLR